MEEEQAKASPWDVFIHLFALIALYASVYGALSILFQCVNAAFPTHNNSLTSIGDEIHYGAALLIIFFPGYLWAWRAVERDSMEHPAKRRMWVRTCSIYLTLFLAGLLALGDIATLVYYFLAGDLAIRLSLKVAAMLVITGGVLIFYRDALWREEPAATSGAARIVRYGAIPLAVGIVTLGIWIAGSPRDARLRDQDCTRIQNLKDIQDKIAGYWQDKGRLPTSLSQLDDDISGYSPPHDPATRDPYDYLPTGVTSFRLCADFALTDMNDAARPATYSWPYNESQRKFWKHQAGHFCFDRTIDPTRYPVKRTAATKSSN